MTPTPSGSGRGPFISVFRRSAEKKIREFRRICVGVKRLKGFIVEGTRTKATDIKPRRLIGPLKNCL